MTPKRAATVAVVAAILSVIVAVPYAVDDAVPVLAVWKGGQRMGEIAVVGSPTMNVFAAIMSVLSVWVRDSDVSIVQFANVAVMVAGTLALLMTVEVTVVWVEWAVYGLAGRQGDFETFMFVSLGATLAAFIAAIHVRIGARARVAAITSVAAAAATVKKAE